MCFYGRLSAQMVLFIVASREMLINYTKFVIKLHKVMDWSHASKSDIALFLYTKLLCTQSVLEVTNL